LKRVRGEDVARDWKAAAARIFTTRRLRYVSFIAPFLYIVSYLLFHTLDYSWPWLVAAMIAAAASIAAFQTVLYRGRQPTTPDESDNDDEN
jgi:hypothetical protein